MSELDDTIGIDAALDEASRLEQAGDHASALNIYQHLHRSAPANLTLVYRLGTACLRLGMLDDAISHLRQVAFHDPGLAAARANLGNAFLLKNQLERAEENFLAALRADSDNRNALFGLASVLMRQGRHEDARPLCERLVALLPDSAAALTIAADAATADPQLNTAIARYRQALRTDPDYVPALIGLAGTLYRRQRLDEALGLLEKAAALNPRMAEALVLKGRILAERQDFAGALEAYSAARELAPDEADLLVELSIVARRQGDFGRAIDFALQAWRASPTSRDASKALGAVLSTLGKATPAREILMAGGQLSAVNPATLQLLEKLAEDVDTIVPIPQAPPPHQTADAVEDQAPGGMDGPSAATGHGREEEREELPLFRGF